MGNPMHGGAGDAFGAGQSSGLGGPHKQVLDAIVAFTDDRGISTEALRQTLRNLNAAQIK